MHRIMATFSLSQNRTLTRTVQLLTVGTEQLKNPFLLSGTKYMLGKLRHQLFINKEKMQIITVTYD